MSDSSYPGDPDVDYSAAAAGSGIAVGTTSSAFNYALIDPTTSNSVTYSTAFGAPASTALGAPAQAVASEVVSTDGAAPPPLKPGWATTEFWLTLIGSGIGIAVGLGLVGPDFAKNHEQLVNAVALLASILAPGMYAVGRSVVKHGHQKAVAQVISTAARSDSGAGALDVLLIIVILIVAFSLFGALHSAFWLLLLVLILVVVLI